MNSQFRDQMEFDEVSLALAIEKSISVNAKALHHTKRPRYSYDQCLNCKIFTIWIGPPRSDMTHITMWAAIMRRK